MIFAAGLSALVLAATGPSNESVPVSRVESKARSRHPGQNGHLTPEQEAMALAAWRYFENNFQPTTCLYNSVDGYPSTTMWDTASSIAGLVAAFEFTLITPPDFDKRMGCLIESLQKMELYKGELPNKAYHTASLQMVDYNNNPGELGVSAIDLGRLLLWLAIVKERYPNHAEAIDRAVLRWNFCNVVDLGGTLYGAANTPDGGVVYLQEGRLGYEEYAAAGFQMWGFKTEAASRKEPYSWLRLYGVPVLYDARDPVLYKAHTYVVSEPYLLSGVELNWDRVEGHAGSDLWLSDRDTHDQAVKVYKAQKRRYQRTGILTARTEHHVDGAPYFIYDTLYSTGVEWNTMADTGQSYPELAAVSTKAAVGLDVLFDSNYTDKLVESIIPLIDPNKGLYEGYYEADGRRINSLTANTNGIVLATLLYQVQGKLYRNNDIRSLWDRVPNGEYPGNAQCLPRTARDPDPANPPEHSGQYEASRQASN
jgi:hypothetical protein